MAGKLHAYVERIIIAEQFCRGHGQLGLHSLFTEFMNTWVRKDGQFSLLVDLYKF